MRVPSVRGHPAPGAAPAEPLQSFAGILFPSGPRPARRPNSEVLADLRLDRIVAAATGGRAEETVEEAFLAPLADLESIRYRHEIFRDLDRPATQAAIDGFAERIAAMHETLDTADSVRPQHQKNRWFLDAAAHYCEAVGAFAEALGTADIRSRGLGDFAAWLARYRQSPGFVTLREETRSLRDEIDSIRYLLDIRGDRVTVRPFADEPEFGAGFLEVFERLGASPRERAGRPPDRHSRMNPIETAILDKVAALHPEPFAELDAFHRRNEAFADPTVLAFASDIRFYKAYLDLIAPLKAAGLPFCLPELSRSDKATEGRQCFDLALALTLRDQGATTVANDFELGDEERILVVSGPNQSGKTTFARMVGQIHYLASLGLPVPGSPVRLFLVDRVFTHFEKAEEADSRHGRLEDDLLRARAILDAASGDSLIVVNDIFGSTTLRDALFLGAEILERIAQVDALCVFVTFAEDLASANRRTVSIASADDPGDATARSYRLERRPPAGTAHAMAVAEKYGLTYSALSERIAP